MTAAPARWARGASAELRGAPCSSLRRAAGYGVPRGSRLAGSVRSCWQASPSPR